MSVAEWWATHIEPLEGAERQRALEAVRASLPKVRRLYTPVDVQPHPKQAVFLGMNRQEVFYGGAAGPGKSTALLMAALQYVDVPDYSALLLRRTFADLSLPGALMEVAKDWLGPTDAHWNQAYKRWTFPSGATLTFGYADKEDDVRRYQGAAFQFIGWDELTQFSESQYRFLFSRLRRPMKPRGGTNMYGLGINDVPLRVRSASNPGGDGHDWVKGRFVDAETRRPGVVFLPARMHENPSLDQAAYLESLAELTPTERERLIEGDWEATEDGGVFAPDLWDVVDFWPGDRAIRWWDLAGSKPTPSYPDPDWTCGMRLELATNGEVCITDVVRFREDPAETEARVAAVADDDGRDCPVAIEQEPGQSGKAQVSHFSRNVLRGKTSVHGFPSTRDKMTRARPVSAAAGRGEVKCLRRPWRKVLYSELRRFPNVKHDDQTDCLSGSYSQVGRLTGRATVGRSTRRLPPPTGSDR